MRGYKHLARPHWDILMLTDALHEDAPGGSRRVVKELSERLAAMGHNVAIAVPRWRGDERAQAEHAGVVVYRYGDGRKGAMGALRLVPAGRHLLAGIRTANGAAFDVLHVHFAYSHLPALLPARLPLARATIRTFYGPWAAEDQAERAAYMPTGANSGMMSRLRFHARRLIERRSLGQANATIVLSEYSRRQLITSYGRKATCIDIIPGGVDHRRFKPPNIPKEILRRRLGLPTDGLMLLCVRRLAGRMGLDYLVDAMPQVLHELCGKAHLVIAGDGPLRTALHAKAQTQHLTNNVHFAGRVSDEDLPLYYQAADLFVLPTRSLEGFGLITLEAFAAGLPVVGTPVGATPELLAQVDKRLILSGSNRDAIADGILRYFNQVAGSIPAAKLREFVLHKYTWPTVVAQTGAIYEQAIDAATATPWGGVPGRRGRTNRDERPRAPG